MKVEVKDTAANTLVQILANETNPDLVALRGAIARKLRHERENPTLTSPEMKAAITDVEAALTAGIGERGLRQSFLQKFKIMLARTERHERLNALQQAAAEHRVVQRERLGDGPEDPELTGGEE